MNSPPFLLGFSLPILLPVPQNTRVTQSNSPFSIPGDPFQKISLDPLLPTSLFLSSVVINEVVFWLCEEIVSKATI